MMERVTCQFCASRCGMVVNLDKGLPFKVASAPCEKACPAGIDIPRYIRHIASRDYGKAVAVVRETAPLPGVLGSVCHHPCEAVCARGTADESLSIRALKGFVAERGIGAIPVAKSPAAPTGKRVAIVGSGPAGLTCGYYLARAGYEVTIFEALPVAGGMLRVGIPAYRLPREVLDQEIEAVKTAGVDIRIDRRIDSLDELFSQGYQAVFLATGAHKGVRLNIDGGDHPQVIDCLSFLRRVSFGEKVGIGDAVAVLGGGFAAIDAARTGRRLGAKQVTIIYRRTRQEMKAGEREVEEALAEGVDMHFLAAPSKIVRSQGKLALECIGQRLGPIDQSGRPRPEAVPGSEFSLEFDTIISAIGQAPDIPKEFGLALSAGKTVLVDPADFRTSREGVFAGGDVVTGPASVVEAIGAGRKAALAIDRYLGGVGAFEGLATASQWIAGQEIGTVVGWQDRLPIAMARVDERTNNFARVEIGFDEDDAVAEANRCLWCDLADGDPAHPLSQGWSCKRGRADTARRLMRSI